MEFLLLWADELDDAIGALRHLAPRILGFLLAIALFVATAFAFMFDQRLAIAVLAVVLSAGLLEVVRRRRLSRQVDG